MLLLKKSITLLLLVLSITLFIWLGRSLYIPIIHKIKGKNTVESVHQSLADKVFKNIESNLKNIGLDTFPDNISLIGLKEEELLQLYTTTSSGNHLVKQYPFTAFSSKLGPKLKEGDKQIPEGIYKVEHLNPNSSYYLSLKVSYPNEFDISKSKLDDIGDIGSDIFIHGKSATVGCIPIGDEAIEEVFIMAQHAFHNEIKVVISPRDFRTQTLYPEIDNINWEVELYDSIKSQLIQFPLNQ